MKFISTFLFAATTAAVLTACGGGGSDPEVQPNQSVSISSANQTDVARATLVGGMSVGAAGGAGGSSSPGPTVAGLHVRSLARLTRQATEAAIGRRQTAAAVHVQSGAATAQAAVHSHVDCAVSGSVDYTVNFAALEPAAGDSLTAVFSNCVDDASGTIDGTMAVSFTSVSTSSGVTHFRETATYTALKFTDGTTTATMNGALTLALDLGASSSTTSIATGSSGLSIAIRSTPYNDTITLGAGLQISLADDSVANTSSLRIDGTISSASLGGSVTLVTVQPIVVVGDDDFPSSGQVSVTGSNGSKLLVTVVDNGHVSLQLDANGDGIYESTTATTWTALIPQS